MKGLILTYIIAYTATVAGLRYPLFALNVYIGLAVLRPQSIFAFAGDISGVSWYVGLSVLAGWALNKFGSWDLRRARLAVIAFAAFIACFLISGFLALNTARAYDSVIDVAKVWAPLLAGLSLIKSERDWRALLWTIVLSQGYVGFEQNLNYLVKGYNTAAEGFGGMDNNFFGLSLVTTIGPAIALTISSRVWWQKALAAISTALILHTILLTFSRGAMVGLVAVFVVFFILMPKRPAHMAALLVVALLAARLTGPQLMARYATTIAGEEERDASAESRVDLWRDCIIVIKQYPVFGVGPANWRTIVSRFGWAEGKSAHSVWMESAAEIGLPGVTALFLFFAFTAMKLLPIARQKQPGTRVEAGAAFGTILGISGFIVSGQFVSAPALEVAYYTTLVGLAILKTHDVRVAQEHAVEVRSAPAAPRVALAGPAGFPSPIATPSFGDTPRPGQTRWNWRETRTG